MKKQYKYLNNKEFLNKISSSHIQEQWVKITLLEYNSEIPIDNIEGEVIDGSLNKAGDSAVRRTCNLTCAVDAFKYDVDSLKSRYSISKKIFLELGVTNNTNEYTEEKVIWFPQGVFFITSFTISASATGKASISLQFKDKMARLDGTIGGVLPSTVRFDTVTTMINGIAHTKKALVYDIIMETVNHFGGEDISNIIIDDVPAKAKRIVRWMGPESLWVYPIISSGGKISYDICFASELDRKRGAQIPVRNNNDEVIGAKEYQINQDIGYVYEDFVYDEELTFKAGAKVTEVLDKIKNWLGNYEYFYDEYGQFHFQEIKNYLNNAQSASIWDKIQETNDNDYLYESTHGKSVYTFDDKTNLISITNTPMYENIKNDFIVEGTVTVGGVKKTCRYHLVIDDKPKVAATGYDNILVYTDPSSGSTTLIKPKIAHPTYNSKEHKYIWSLPEFADDGIIYGLLDEPTIVTGKKQLKSFDSFGDYYNNLVLNENALITNETIVQIVNNENNSIIDSLLSLLEKYMGYTDTTAYKSLYYDVIFTLARQLRRYGVLQRTPTLTSTTEYYQDLYTQWGLEISKYGNNSNNVRDKVYQCGGLLQLLYELFNMQDVLSPVSYKNLSYWPAINTSLNGLWDNYTSWTPDDSNLTVIDTEYKQRIHRCQIYIEDVKIKQKQLNILIEQYLQLISNYNVLINMYDRKSTLSENELTAKNQLVVTRDIIQGQIDNYKAQRDICEQRQSVLYSVLTRLGCPDVIVGETYTTVDISIPVHATSFWYYNANIKEETYGWNELEWYQYYCKQEVKDGYPDELGSMTYIDFANLEWDDIAVDSNDNNDITPSMNRYSHWYQTYYVDYAQNHELSYFNNSRPDVYVPVNWRTELFLMGLQAEMNGTDPGHYYEELKLNWPTVYDFKNEQLSPSSINYINYYVACNGVIIGDNYTYADESFQTNDNSKALFKSEEQAAQIKDFFLAFENGSYYYFFDMIDSSSPTWGEYSVNNIGRRTNVTVSDSVNCLFAPTIPDYAFLNISGMTTKERKAAYEDLSDIAEEIIQVTDNYYQNFATGGFKQSAYNQIRYDLQQYTTYQNTVSITALPCFYLEPNVRVALNDHSTGTFGDYVVKSVSIPLGAGNAMSVSLTKAMEKI